MKLKKIKHIITAGLLFTLAVLTDGELSRSHAQTPSYPVRVTNIRFINGIGRGPTSTGEDNISTYYRGYGLSGTLIELTAEMSLDGGTTWGAPIYGDVQFTVSYTDGTDTGTFNITMGSGSNTATTEIPYNTPSGFDETWITSGTTENWTYTATLAEGDYVENSGLAGSITSGTSQAINWDYGDPPSSGSPAITVNQVVISATSLTLYWTPVDTLTDRDFYEYRIYYREEDTSTYKQWNSANDSTLGGLSNNPSGTTNNSALHFDSNGWKYTTIPNLKLFTGYEYYITAVDVFGNEISEADAGPVAASRLIRTLPLKVDATISDGITSYSDFSDLTDPSLRSLRESNIRVDIYTISAVTQPDECIIWFSTTAAPAADTYDMLTLLLEPNTAELGTNLDSVSAIRTGPNIWTAYLPTIPSTGKDQIVTTGNSIRFIVELKNRGISTFVDHDSGDSPNNAEWTFSIGTPVIVTPWPVRILNNVITDSNPRAYPAYYLTENAYVTIRVYDIKGRPVTILLDQAFRRGGQNIKEEGWAGTNKSGRKLGIGLYYIHIKAKSVENGKVILDSFKKVVMRR